MDESELLEAGKQGDESAFGELVAPYRGELHAHCYRMLGSVQDAEDALQEAMLGAWRGLKGFEGRSSLRSWLYRIATHACLRLQDKRPKRLLSFEHAPALGPLEELGEPLMEPVWIEPYPAYELRESVELAFVAALQHLPGNQRAVLILREVLGFSAAEVARTLDTTVASVNSALQRARKTVDERVPERSQQATLRALGEDGQRELVDAFVTAWEGGDVPALLGMLAKDARFTMPPLLAWFDGREDIGVFLAERCLVEPWRLVPIKANGQLGFACYQRGVLGAINILTLDGDKITEISAFLDPAVTVRLAPMNFPPTLL